MLLAVAMIAAGPAGLPTLQGEVEEKTVTVDAGEDQSAEPGASVSLEATVKAEDGSQVTGYKWEQIAGPPAEISGADSDTLTATLGDAAAYKAALMAALVREDRFGVQAINPHSLEAGETATFKVTVTTTSGDYSDEVGIIAKLPYIVSPGISNVPINAPVLLNGKVQDAYSWTLTGPSGAKATLDDPADRNPSFTPDVEGKYTLTEETSGATFDVYAGTWMGVIVGLDANGEPEVNEDCTDCHDDDIAPNTFAPWKASGHAEIFTQNIDDPSGHWSLGCAGCHTVGYDPEADNGGFDEAAAKEGWEVPHGAVGNYAQMLEDYPATAQLANIQCENCHGPQESDAHKKGAPRQNISSELCGACHGEPARHGRFQQWEESGHANLELALVEATVEGRGAAASHCGRCHSGEGFLAWVEQDDLTQRIQGAAGDATVEELTALGLTEATVHSQTCVVCHDPHQQGKTSGEPNTAGVRIEGNTSLLPAGFKAVGVGRGAICITCHNTRNGAHNDAVGLPANYQAPHTAAQGDVLLGENAYFVSTGERANHSFIQDACAGCHMEVTPPPAELSYNLAGTNHTFKASPEVCGDCHGAFRGAGLQASTEAMLHELAVKMSDYLLNKMPDQVHLKDYTPHESAGQAYDLKSNDVTLDKANIVSVEPTEPHGQQGYLLKLETSVEVTYAPEGEAAHTLSLTELEVQLGDITTDGEAVLIDPGDPLVRVGWNYFLIHADGSEGVHNPSFAMKVLRASMAALD